MFPKLVRDRIPDEIRRRGAVAHVRTAAANEATTLLLAKLREEVGELCDTPNVDEFADVHEVLAALASALGFSAANIRLARIRKRREKGSFRQLLVLEGIEEARAAIGRGLA